LSSFNSSALETLIVQLKRFKHDIQEVYKGHYRQTTSKTHSIVKFPLTNLQLKDNYSDLSPNTDDKYDLIAIVLHKGTCNFGHYIAYAKNRVNGEWYEFNDSTVVHIPVEEIESEIVTKDAYVLIYQKHRNLSQHDSVPESQTDQS
jgi:ubiquitin carboxyl-terminal hydrolase 4/11/15